MLKHYLFSDQINDIIKTYDKFDAEVIKNDIVKHLEKYPNDLVEHQREYINKNDYGNDIVNFYEVNPKNKQPSVIITKGNNEYYKSLNKK